MYLPGSKYSPRSESDPSWRWRAEMKALNGSVCEGAFELFHRFVIALATFLARVAGIGCSCKHDRKRCFAEVDAEGFGPRKSWAESDGPTD
jgi:hypothetical protein